MSKTANLICTCGGAMFKTDDVATGSTDPRKAVSQILTCAVPSCGKQYRIEELRAAQSERAATGRTVVTEIRRRGYRSER